MPVVVLLFIIWLIGMGVYKNADSIQHTMNETTELVACAANPNCNMERRRFEKYLKSKGY